MPTQDLRRHLRRKTAAARAGRLLEAARAAMPEAERRAFDEVRKAAQLPSEEPKVPRARAVPAKVRAR